MMVPFTHPPSSHTPPPCRHPNPNPPPRCRRVADLLASLHEVQTHLVRRVNLRESHIAGLDHVEAAATALEDAYSELLARTEAASAAPQAKLLGRINNLAVMQETVK